MADKPIIFSGEMVRAILEGRKTQTRRVLKPQPEVDSDGMIRFKKGGWFAPHVWRAAMEVAELQSPYDIGDRLYVREAIWQSKTYPSVLPSGETDDGYWGQLLHYAADGKPPNTPNRHYPDGLRGGHFAAPDPYAVWLKRPSIHMPRWASRLTLIVTDVRVERVQDISEDDAKAEGIPEGFGGDGGPIEDFICFWNKLHGAFAFNDNDWVAALTFTAHQANIDDLAKREVA